jgi:hypothetical protein
MSGAQGNATKVVNAAQQTQQALSNAGKTVVSALQSSQPAKMIPLLLGLASLTALFVGFGMQYFLIGHGKSAKERIDPLMKNSVSTITSIAVLSIIGVGLYYALQQIERPFFWLFVLVMIQLMFLHVALSASLYQVQITS